MTTASASSLHMELHSKHQGYPINEPQASGLPLAHQTLLGCAQQ